MAAESGKIDPMHQFMIEPLFGQGWSIAGHNIAFTNSAMWMVVTLVAMLVFMVGGMKRELVPGRWQAAVESFTGFISGMMATNVGPEGKKFVPYVFSLFMFILIANIMGMMPTGVVGVHPFTVTSHLTVTGVLAVISFAIVLIVGFWRHGFHFFSLFVPHGTPGYMVPLIFVIDSWALWPVWVAMLVWPAATAVLALAVLRRAKGVFLAIIWATRSPGSERR